MSKIETERLAVIFFKEEMQGNLCCCLSVMGLGGSPRHPLALGQSGFLWPWPLLVSYPIYKLIHSLTWLLLHWCFSRHWREGNIISLVFVLLPTTLLLTLFSVTALCFPLFPAFLDSALPFHIFLFLTLNLPLSCSPTALWTPFFSCIILHFFLTRIFFSCLAQELNFAGKNSEEAAASPVPFSC